MTIVVYFLVPLGVLLMQLHTSLLLLQDFVLFILSFLIFGFMKVYLYSLCIYCHTLCSSRNDFEIKGIVWIFPTLKQPCLSCSANGIDVFLRGLWWL